MLTKISYRNRVGSLMYFTVTTRPDIAFAVSMLSQFVEKFGKQHWMAAKRVLRYLRKTTLIGVQIMMILSSIQDKSPFLETWQSNWEARKQNTVTLSTTAAEYMEMSEASKKAIHLKQLIKETTGESKMVTLDVNNQEAERPAMNPIFHVRTKHIDIRHHFIRDVMQRKKVELCCLPNELMIADLLTKALLKEKHKKCISNFGIEKKWNENPDRIQ
ncbi:Retrovirus-related Pol polyprotein from transposon TNT 1-94 [Trichinella papuae]|uniref:Retrovirus-related Pol polyprotein from transposon TNT 1-94 n=1 Tax=Trichinella papuae TaxID=268474 RepID=A0A0V1M8M7_9BILA|nr:Retrovirus-related Pol polyprotein from transposon TNT 1-94 [Trichinella papuae]